MRRTHILQNGLAVSLMMLNSANPTSLLAWQKCLGYGTLMFRAAITRVLRAVQFKTLSAVFTHGYRCQNYLVTVLAGLCFFGSIIWLILDKKQKPVIKCRKGGVAAFFIFASVGIAVMGLNWILSFFIIG